MAPQESREVETPDCDREKETCCFCVKGKVAEWWKKNAKTDNTKFVMGCVVIGVAVGLGVNAAVDPGSAGGKRWAFWLGFPGTMFLRALKCLVVPLIFCSMVAGVGDLSRSSSISAVGKHTMATFLFTTLMAALEGLVWISIFKGSFVVLKGQLVATGAAVSLQCPAGGFATDSGVPGSALSCQPAGQSGPASTFLLYSPDLKISIAGVVPTKTFDDALVDVFYSLVPSNLLAACTAGDILSVITFALFFGLVASSLPTTQNHLVLDFFIQLSHVFQAMITTVVSLAPLAIMSLIVSALAVQQDMGTLLVNVGMFTLCCTLGLLGHVLFVLTPLYRHYVGEFPLEYMRKMAPACALAFSCASSVSTLPLTMRCVDSTRTVSLGLRKFILTLGATVNMDGAAIYFSCAIVFVAVTGGHADKVDFKTLLMCTILSTLGSVAASPIPNSGLVMLVTIWDTVFPGIPIPPQVAYVQAIDFFIDRVVTVVNVLGDTFVTRIVQAMHGCITEEELRLLEEEIALCGPLDEGKDRSLASGDSATFSRHNAL